MDRRWWQYVASHPGSPTIDWFAIFNRGQHIATVKPVPGITPAAAQQTKICYSPNATLRVAEPGSSGLAMNSASACSGVSFSPLRYIARWSWFRLTAARMADQGRSCRRGHRYSPPGAPPHPEKSWHDRAGDDPAARHPQDIDPPLLDKPILGDNSNTGLRALVGSLHQARPMHARCDLLDTARCSYTGQGKNQFRSVTQE